MNILEGTVNRIISGRVNLVEIKTRDTLIKCVTLGLPPYVTGGARVRAMFKETSAMLCRIVPPGIAAENIFSCTVLEIKKGAVLAETKLSHCGSVITVVSTVEACDGAGHGPGMQLYVLLGASEISLMEA
jgi:molybdopterin-binding protein